MISAAKSDSQMKLGEHMIIVGFVVQVLFFRNFCCCGCYIHKRISAHPTTNSLGLSVPWKRYLFVLYAARALIFGPMLVSNHRIRAGIIGVAAKP